MIAQRKRKWLNFARVSTGLVIFAAGLWFFLAPSVIVGWYIATDKGLSGAGVSKFAYSRHQLISDDYARYARERIGSGKAESLKSWQIAETEWPLFGSAFYLWSTESFQKAWEKDPSLSEEAPKVYAREAIDAAKDLILDRGHAKCDLMIQEDAEIPTSPPLPLPSGLKKTQVGMQRILNISGKKMDFAQASESFPMGRRTLELITWMSIPDLYCMA